MIRGITKPVKSKKGAALRRRIREFYRGFNKERWDRCYSQVDPKLRASSRVDAEHYASGLEAFRRQYGEVEIWHVRVNLYLEAKKNKHDGRPFAYVYVFWQDGKHTFHVFRERWVLDGGKWYTRVA